MNRKIYWQIRQIMSKIVFYLKRLLFNLRERANRTYRMLPFKKMILREITIRLFTSLLGIILTTHIDKWLLEGNKSTAFSNAVFLEITLGGMSIAGVILGLYCSNLSSIFSAQYTNAPDSIADSFQADLITRGCIKSIINYIVICVLFLLVCITGNSIYYASMLFLLIATIHVVITFSVTGNRTYALSDSFRIAKTIRMEIFRIVKNTSNHGNIASDRSFQKHFGKICEQKLNILSDIIHYNKNSSLEKNQAVYSFMEENLDLLSYYWSVKSSIPFNSYWYKSATTYQQWHNASDYDVKSQLQAGRPLPPKEKRNIWWFEDQLLKTNEIGFSKILSQNDVGLICNYLHKIANLSLEASKAKNLEYWINILDALFDTLKQHICVASNKGIEKNTETFAALAECLCVMYHNMISGINQELRTLSLDAIFKKAKESRKFSDLNLGDYGIFNCSECEIMYHHIESEYSIEHKRITPDWYIEQVVSYQIHKECKIILQILKTSIDNIFDLGKSVLTTDTSYIASVVFTHFFTLKQEVNTTIDYLNDLLTVLETKHYEKSVFWDRINTEDIEARLKQIDKDMPSHIVKCCGAFTLKHWNDRGKVPDFLGGFYNYLFESMISSIEQDDYVSFEIVYQSIFPVVLLYSEYIRTDVMKRKEPHLQMANLASMSFPLIDFATISGLAIIWGGNLLVFLDGKYSLMQFFKSIFLQEKRILKPLITLFR